MNQPSPNERQAGFTLLELSMSMVSSAVVLLVLYSSVTLSVQSQRTVAVKNVVSRYAHDFMLRLREVPFGTAAEPAASAAQLSELFDDDDDLGRVSLSQLVVPVAGDGHGFDLADGERALRFRIRVTRDLDGDGVVAGGREGRSDILRLEVWVDDRRVLTSMRAADPALTTKDP